MCTCRENSIAIGMVRHLNKFKDNEEKNANWNSLNEEKICSDEKISLHFVHARSQFVITLRNRKKTPDSKPTCFFSIFIFVWLIGKFQRVFVWYWKTKTAPITKTTTQHQKKKRCTIITSIADLDEIKQCFIWLRVFFHYLSIHLGTSSKNIFFLL